MTRSEIIHNVLVKLDEITPFDDLSITGGADNLANPVRATVEALLDDCASQVQQDAPPSMCAVFDFKSTITQEITDATVDGVMTVPLSADFIKLGMLDLTCWNRPISRTYPAEHPIYLIQKNKYTRGGLSRPVGIIVKTPTAFNLECYTVTKPTSVEGFVKTATYIKRIAIELLPDGLLDAATWLCVARTKEAIGQADYPKVLEEYTQRIAMLWSSLS